MCLGVSQRFAQRFGVILRAALASGGSERSDELRGLNVPEHMRGHGIVNNRGRDLPALHSIAATVAVERAAVFCHQQSGQQIAGIALSRLLRRPSFQLRDDRLSLIIRDQRFMRVPLNDPLGSRPPFPAASCFGVDVPDCVPSVHKRVPFHSNE
ncbi:hypothetical protein [Casimicrobium huifangae]|uniref:hypothetical protein n=1 Tax=Casimicrobium huifangae TaxID=2591109 RepID=UPI003784665D